MRKIQFANEEHYHIFNRGVDKREIFSGGEDIVRFLQSMDEFNSIDPIGSIYENSLKLGDLVSKRKSKPKLVDFVCYCLNPNHYHFILRQREEKGIEKFMHRIGVGYTMFFNKKHKRSGSLFQGTFKAVHISTNEQLLHTSAYVNLNDRVHRLGDLVSKSSWGEYEKGVKGFCEKDVILGQFNNIKEYKDFAESSLADILERRDMEKLLLE
ncbi:MAG TPA: hypothetical protein ENG99_00195 [bacterium]|nr:hypothetical protein [bacterium]